MFISSLKINRFSGRPPNFLRYPRYLCITYICQLSLCLPISKHPRVASTLFLLLAHTLVPIVCNATMEENRAVRRRSGIYETNQGSTHSFDSGASLQAHAALPAGVATTTNAGVSNAPIIHTVTPRDTVSGWDDQLPPAVVAPVPATQRPATQRFYKKRWFIISQIIIIPLAIALLFIILFPVIHAIVELVVKRTNLHVDLANITQSQNGSFHLALQGKVFNTGIFPAKIMFTENTTVAWVENETTETPLGFMQLHDLTANHKQATINDSTTFFVTDQAAFGRFSSSLITSHNFTWRLTSYNLRVQALKFPVAKSITFDKFLTLNGFNSFDGNVVLRDLQLPSDNPAGGINFVAVTEINNPSAFALDLGTVVFALSYLGVPLGNGTGTNTKIVAGNNTISLAGTLQPQTDPANLAALSKLFTNYLNGKSSPVIAQGLSTSQADGSSISWLSQGLQGLQLNVPFQAFTPINPIRSISIGDLALQFDQQLPFNPQTESNSVKASLQLPFGFDISIGEIQNEFMIVNNGNPVANLSTPLGASVSSISVLNSTDTSGLINISISDTRLNSSDPQHAAFSAFNQELTSSSVAEFRLIGQSRAIANLSIGQITLDSIDVNVSTSLNGLQGLNGFTTINSVDVTGGTADAINLSIEVAIFNPSNLDLSTGDITLHLFRDGAVLGTALLPNLTLNMGNNTINSTSNFEANQSPQGIETLNDFLGKKDVQLTIAGFNGSTQIPSLVQAFNSLQINVTLPALKTNLLNSAALEILPSTGIQNNISHVTVSLANPFSAPLRITKVSSTVTSFGVSLGSIDQDIDFTSAPKSTTQSPQLDLDMNFDPAALFTVTRALAVEAGMNVAPLDEIVQLGGIQYLSIANNSTPSKRQDNIFSGFDLPSFVGTAFKQLRSDVQLSTDVTIGEYNTTLQFTQAAVPTTTDNSLNLILPILAQPIVQKIVSGAVLGLDNVLIINPQQNAFQTQLKGSITNAGPFDAVISFPSGLTISWEGQPIGKVTMNNLNVVANVGGTIDTETTFEVLDLNHLTNFTKVLLTTESFVWDISGENLTVSALGISVPGISFPSRSVTLKGFNNLNNGVQIQTFDLPANDPAGGIHLTLEANAINPSQVGIQLSSLGFNTFVGDVMIAPVTSTGSVTLSPLSTSQLSLVGRLIPQQSTKGLATVSSVFNNFVHGNDSAVIVQGSSAGSSNVTWLNEGIQALQVATVLPNRGLQRIIKSITLNELSLFFTPQTAFSPVTGSNSTDAAFTLPFAFPLDITALQQTITIGSQGADFAQLAIPKGPSTTDVQARIIHLGFENVPFAVFNNARANFEQFVAATTTGASQTLRLSGSANADANTAVGLLSLTDIEFSVDSNVAGLQGLNARPVTVSNLDVNHGFSDFLLIKVSSAIFNPSNLTIGTGDVSFSLQFQDATIGTAQVSNLVIIPGNATYPIDVHYAPQGNALPAGQALLQNFLQGIDAATTIAGTTESTTIESLQSALSQIRLSPVTIPGLQKTLITSASLTFPTNIVATGIATTSFTLANPFTASINLLKVAAIATFHNLTLGEIPNVDTSANPIRAVGHGQVTSPGLALKFNLDPSTIIQLLLLTSQENNVGLGPLPQLFQFVLGNPNFKPPVTTSVDTQAPTCVSGQQFDVNGAILASLSNLEVDLAVQTSVKLDDFATDLAFAQKGVPAITDKTSLFLIGAVAGPIAQNLVNGAVLAFTTADITNITNEGFDLSLKGSLTNVGPLDALITFVEPATVTFQGKPIAQIVLPPICAAANVGVPDYETNAHLIITDTDSFTEFAIFLLHNPSFTWTISTPKLRLTALGTTFDGVSLSKDVSFKAFNGLPGVTISNFQLPSDDPAGGIHIETDASIPSPSQLGINLGTVTFQSFFQNTLVGPLSANNLVLTPNDVSKTHLSGRIIPQTGADLDVLGELFSGFLADQNITLITKGFSVQPPGSSQPVDWLTTAFQSLSLEVILPGEKLQVIKQIDLTDLTVTIQTQDQAFMPPTSSQHTVAKYSNPFGFSLQVIQSGQTIILASQGTDIAQLVLPKVPVDGGVSTGNLANLDISFQNIPLTSLNNGAFEQLLSGVTINTDVGIELKGAANVTAKTSIGDVPISGIPFDVTSDLKGISAFGGTAALSNVSVVGSGGVGGSEFVVAPLHTTLQNPSNVSLNTVNISLPVIFNGVNIGRTAINEFDLKPGENVIGAEFHYKPADANDTVAQGFLSQFIQTGNQLDLTINGDTASSPFASLQLALSNLHLSTHLNGLNHPTIITQIDVAITLDTLVTNLVSVDFTVQNPLEADLVIEFVQADAGVNGEIFARFSQGFSSFVVPPGQSVNSGVFGNVLLTQGALASLGIIPLGELDVSAAVTVRVGTGGYEIPFLKLSQTNVPTKYNLDLDLLNVLAGGSGSPVSTAVKPSQSSDTVRASSTVKSPSAPSSVSANHSSPATAASSNISPATSVK